MKNNSIDLGRFGRSMTTKLTVRAAIALLVASASATWCLFAMSNTGSIVNPSKNNITVPDAPSVVPFVDIASAGPLTHVYLGNELSSQVAHTGDSDFEFYPPATIPGDSGTFIAMGGTLYAPDFIGHGETATGSIGARVVFTPISQTGVTGAGTTADPFKVVTVVDVSTTGLRIQQTDTYVVGDESYRTDVMITNTGGLANGVLYRAGDAFLSGSDLGFGFTEVFGTRKAVGCSVNPNNIPPGRIEEWVPLTGGNNFYQNFYNSIWIFIGTKAPFPDTCGCATFQDNGAGISWNFSIPTGGSATYSHVTTFSPLGRQALVTSKTADSATSVAGSQNGYTITIENPNPDPVTLNSITDTLPAGFSYISGSTTGVTTSDPTVSAQMLTWSGPFVVAPNSSVSLHFAVTVASTAGDYFNEAGGEAAGGYTVTSTGPIAQITVTPGPTPTATPTLTIAISGTISYCPNSSPVPGVTLNLTGDATTSTMTDGSGNYQFSSLAPGTYTVMPSKAALTPGSAGINTVDVMATQGHYLTIAPIPPGCGRDAADVNGDNRIDTSDVVAIQRFFLGRPFGFANVGKYQFTPASRMYTSVVTNQTGQDYDTLVFGDVASSFVHRPDGPSQTAAGTSVSTLSGLNTSAGEVPATVATLSLPNVAVDTFVTNFNVQVTTTAIAAKNKLVGFQGDFTFDERVVTFQSEPVQKAGITGGNWNVAGNVLPGAGPIRTLRISAYSNDFTPLSGSGTLFELNMTRVSKGARGTPLLWSAPPNQFIFIDADLKTQKPGHAAPGSVTPSRKRN